MTDSRLLDSSAWLSYFYADNKEIKSIIESDSILLTSSISIFEIKKKLMKDKTESSKLEKTIEFIKKRSLIINVDFLIADAAVELSIKNNLATIDALIYSSSKKNNSILITLNNDFRNLNDVVILNN